MTVKSEDREQGLTAAASRVEWAASLGAFAVILGLVGFLLSEARSRPLGPPSLHVEITGFKKSAQQIEVQVLVENRGGQGAHAVTLQGQSTSGAVVRTAMLEQSPPLSSRTVTMVFDQPVEAHEVRVWVSGYAGHQ